MSGLFKMPNLPRPTRPRDPIARPGSSGTSRWTNPLQIQKKLPEPWAVPTRNVPPVNTTKNLMDMDETLLNAVDLAGIERRATNTPPAVATQPSSSTGEVKRNGILREARLRVASPKIESPKRKKSRGSGKFAVLDMEQLRDKSFHEPKNQSQRSSIMEPTRKPSVAASTKARTSLFPRHQPQVERQSPVCSTPKPHRFRIPTPPSPPAVAPVDSTPEPFAFDGQLITDSELDRFINEDPPEEASPPVVENQDEEEDFPCYQQSSADREEDAPEPNCSQLLQDEVDNARERLITRIGAHLNSNETYSIVKNNEVCSQYIRQERSMIEENQANLIDDQINSQLARAFDSIQPHQQRQVRDIFEEYERTLMDMSNLQFDDDEEEEQEDPEQLAQIDWDQDVTMAGEMKKPEVANVVARKSGPLVSSYFKDLGPFFGLPAKVQYLLSKHQGIKDLYDWQKDCLGLTAIVERNNLIYALPTSGGKTLVAEILMFREVMLRRRNVMFVVPYVSLAQEKLAALSPFAVTFDFLVEEYSGGKGIIPPRKRRKKPSIFVCTIEKALVLLDSLIEAGRAGEVGLVVIDELHMIGEDRRGVNLEALVTKIIAIEAGIQVVGMSATIGNLNELAKFMEADIYCRDFRPVELKEYVKIGPELMSINPKAVTLQEAFKFERKVDADYTEDKKRVDPDHVIGMVLEVIPAASCLLFCPTKRQCEQLCLLMVEHLPKELRTHRADEKQQLVNMLKAEGSTAALLQVSCLVGVAYHHSGLTFDERRHIEDAYRSGVICLIVCTSTLAAGVNLPAKRVIIRSPYIAANFLTLSRYKQMVGRAGRAGFGETGDSIMICDKKDTTAVCNLLCSPMDEVVSSLHANECAHLKNLILSAVGLGICATRNDIQRFVARTLLAIQAERLGVDLRKITDRCVTALYKENAIKAKSDGCVRNPQNMTIRFDELESTQEQPVANGSRELTVTRGAEGSSQEGKLVKQLKKSSRLEVNRLGKAAIRAGFHMEKAIRYYDEMKRVGERLNVLDELHLLYVVVLEDNGEIRPTDSDYVAFFNVLTPEDATLAKRFHIGDYTISQILSKRSVPQDILPAVRRFYRVLIVYEMWNLRSPTEVSLKFKVDAGSIQTLISATAATASSLQRLCEEIPEMWAFRQLLATMVQRLSHCCTAELIPLMELPSVKISRARQLYRAGFTSLSSIAKAKASELVEKVEYMSHRTANQLILSSKAKLMEEMEVLRDQMEGYQSLLIGTPST